MQQILDIGIGEQSATPKPPSGPTGLFSNLESNIKCIAIGVAAIGLIYVLSKAAPSVASGISKTTKATVKS